MPRLDVRRRGREAFTLMEVLLVLVILVVLGSLAVSVYTGIRKSALKQAAQVQVNTLSDQCTLYFNSMNAFPTALQDLRVRPGVANADQWAGPYADRDIGPDPWGQEYHYQFPGTKHGDEKPDIWSDGQPGENIPIYNN
jgi:general secretion pathway protein G